MMMRLEMIQMLQYAIIALLSYLPTVGIAGWFEAWVAKKCGDDVPEQLGFLTVNPLIHFDLIGFACMLFFKGVPGWGRYVPMNPTQTRGWRVELQFYARPLCHFFMALASLVGMVIMLKSGYLMAPGAVGAFAKLITFFYTQNALLSVMYFAIGTFRTIVHSYFPEFYPFFSEHIIWGMLILFGAMVLFGEAFRIIVSTMLWYPVQYFMTV
ncbi:hypothetical protein KBD08_01295 [Candidatus Babeliales bacterium]|nr:hypothetical protein [Candidatus Babeliales bacterium]